MRISSIIERQFAKHRILFWYDPQQEFRDEYWALQLPDGCKKIEVVGDEFGVKHRILILEPEAKFLLYFAYAEPSYQENWLLDLQLSEGVLHIDTGSLWLQELGLERNRFLELTREHKHFFKAGKRLAALKQLVDIDSETPVSLRLKMLAVCAGCEARWEELLLSLLAEFAHNRDEKLKLIGKCHLEQFFWEQMAINYGYQSALPQLKSMVIEQFESSIGIKEHQINQDGIHVIMLMKNLGQYGESFELLSAKCSEWIDAPSWLERQDLDTLLKIDLFEYAERIIILMLVEELENGMGNRELQNRIDLRRNSHWYKGYETQYLCLGYAADYLEMASGASKDLHGLQSGFDAYGESLHLVDLYYRKFCVHYSRLQEGRPFERLSRRVEDHYGNSFIFRLGASWTELLPRQGKWQNAVVPPQAKFWSSHILPYLQQNKKIFVIISDALRYEVAAELASLIRSEDRFDAQLSAMAGALPSITAVGMAALLPHEKIGWDGKGNVTVDGKSSSGLQNRMAALRRYHERSVALRADEVMKMPLETARTLYTEYDVIYVYHNAIDIIGDKRETEEKVFEAVETALMELMALVRRLSSGNANNIIITADHGFLYQRYELSEDQFLDDKISLGEGDMKLRRCIIGKKIEHNPNLLIYKAEDLGLTGDVQIAIPLANQRMRQSGSGSRYVHGGASLQEICIPLLQVSKKRVSDVAQVDVEIRRSGSKTISSGVLVFRLYQVQPVSEKMQGRTLRICLYNNAGEAISEIKTLIFDSEESSDKARDNECRLNLTSKADNAHEATLRLEEKIPGTDKYKVHRSESYTISRMFELDF